MDMAINDDDYDEMYRAIHNREDIASDLSICVLEVKNFYKEWIESIDITASTPQTNSQLYLIKQMNFLSFNYTNTLEKFYNIDEN